jgi:hypothetical protein
MAGVAPQSNQRRCHVTGAHAIKTGVFMQEGRRLHDNVVNKGTLSVQQQHAESDDAVGDADHLPE